MTRYPMRPDLKMLIYAMLLVGVIQPTYNYSVQICYTILPMHWATQQISPMTVLVQTNYLLPHKLVPYPLMLKISILASALYQAIRNCYCCLIDIKQLPSSAHVDVASIIQAPRCGATVCCTHLRLNTEWGFRCEGNVLCAQILGAYINSSLSSIITLIGC